MTEESKRENANLIEDLTSIPVVTKESPYLWNINVDI